MTIKTYIDMRKLIVRIAYIIWALKRINKVCLSRKVMYKGEECYLTQGASNPYWNLSGIKTGIRYEYVHKNEFKVIRTLSEAINAFKFHYNWVKSYWFLIDTWHKGLFSHIQGTKF